jgi:hypothetical protein
MIEPGLPCSECVALRHKLHDVRAESEKYIEALESSIDAFMRAAAMRHWHFGSKDIGKAFEEAKSLTIKAWGMRGRVFTGTD